MPLSAAARATTPGTSWEATAVRRLVSMWGKAAACDGASCWAAPTWRAGSVPLAASAIVVFKTCRRLGPRMIPIVCSGRSGAFPDQVELGNALDLFIVACLFRKPGFHPSGQAQGHAFPGHALSASTGGPKSHAQSFVRKREAHKATTPQAGRTYNFTS